MKRSRLVTAAAGVAAAIILAAPAASPAGAGIDINIGINLPLPEVVIASPPAVVVVPGTYVYFAPDAGVEIFFYQGRWYRPHGDRWYRSGSYNGPWVVVTTVPAAVVEAAPAVAGIPPGLSRIPYGQLKKNWRQWEERKRWSGERSARRHPGKGKGRHGR